MLGCDTPLYADQNPFPFASIDMHCHEVSCAIYLKYLTVFLRGCCNDGWDITFHHRVKRKKCNVWLYEKLT